MNESGFPVAYEVAMRALPLDGLRKYWDGLEEVARREKKVVECVRMLCLADLFYLLVRACRRVDMWHPWIYARVREVEGSPDGHLDLWARW